MRYDIVPYSPELDAQIVALQQYMGSSISELNAAYLKWKYAENPFLRDRLMYLALSEGRVVGMRAMVGTLWQVDEAGASHLLPYSDDLVVAPEHRNRGLVGQMMQAAVEDLRRRGFPLAISMSAGPITYVASLALGWRAVGSYYPVRRGVVAQPSPRRSRLRTMLGRVPWLQRVARLRRVQRAQGLFQSLDEAGSYGGGIALSQAPRSEAMAELVARLPWDGRIRHIRDARYFSWRFPNPHH
jgi:GNAT superfamily N-acetyltransferase